MGEYRLYCLDGAGKIGFADWIEAADDEEAVAKARELKKSALICEVWQRHRLVATIEGGDRGE